jgi:protocatechuate 3,4-dioxygenase beta subunit
MNPDHKRRRVLNLNGRPVADTRIEIWQCDANGENFQRHGHTITDAAGRYRFRTTKERGGKGYCPVYSTDPGY